MKHLPVLLAVCGHSAKKAKNWMGGGVVTWAIGVKHAQIAPHIRRRSAGNMEKCSSLKTMDLLKAFQIYKNKTKVLFNFYLAFYGRGRNNHNYFYNSNSKWTLAVFVFIVTKAIFPLSFDWFAALWFAPNYVLYYVKGILSALDYHSETFLGQIDIFLDIVNIE